MNVLYLYPFILVTSYCMDKQVKRPESLRRPVLVFCARNRDPPHTLPFRNWNMVAPCWRLGPRPCVPWSHQTLFLILLHLFLPHTTTPVWLSDEPTALQSNTQILTFQYLFCSRVSFRKQRNIFNYISISDFGHKRRHTETRQGLY